MKRPYILGMVPWTEATVVLVLCLLWSNGCSSKVRPKKGDASTDSAVADASEGKEVGPLDGEVNRLEQLCDGSSELKFAITQHPGGEFVAGTQVLHENGSYYLLVDGHCQLVAYSVLEGGVGLVQIIQLDGTERDSFIEAFRLQDWAELAGEYCIQGVFDYPVWYAMLNGVEITFRACAPGEEDTSKSILWLVDVFESYTFQKVHWGSEGLWSGDIRYFLVQEVPSSRPDELPYQNAPTWTLSQEAASISVSLEEAEQLGREATSYIAAGEDAEALRRIRRLAQEGSIYTFGYRFTGVVDKQGRRYRLFQRDSITLENAEGKLPLAWLQ